jgi:hypothetical protein
MQCYYCGQKANTKEHAPPKMLFKGFPFRPIKVPSCESHNTEKSGLDRVIIRSLLRSVDWHQDRNSFHNDILTLIENSRDLFDEDKRKIVKGYVLDKNGDAVKSVSHVKISQSDLDIWLRQMTAALVCKAIKRYESSINWDEAVIHTPLTPSSASDIPEDIFSTSKSKYENLVTLSEKFVWRRGWCSNGLYATYPPYLYYLDVNINNDGDVIFCHTFLSVYKFFLIISLPRDVRDILYESSTAYPDNDS